jgi:4-hydroxybenzoate polyprenyltransferase
MNLAVALRLGRISNLPTVWTNVLTGAVLATGAAAGLDSKVPLLLVALSLFYIGGMFLNDAFDSQFDAKLRPGRPIPSGQVTSKEVFVYGFLMIGLGLLLLSWTGHGFQPETGWRPLGAGVGLAAAIVFYNWHHKNNPLGPVVMGLCRMLVYLCAAFALQSVLPGRVYVAALALLCYLIGLTYAAKQEHLARIGSVWPLAFLAVPLGFGIYLSMEQKEAWVPLVAFAGCTGYALWRLWRRKAGDVPRGVVSLIAGISLLDAVFLASQGALWLSVLAVAAFALTLALQGWVTGT